METYFTFANLHKAYLDCRNGKTETKYHLLFFENLEKNLLLLERELKTRTYKPGRSIAFVVQKPKIREIFAADFRDRVVHHLLYNYLSPIFERYFIYDSWACRKGKGTHGAMFRLVEFARKLERERERERESSSYRTNLSKGYHKQYYLKMDIKSFFTSIDQRILYGLIAGKIKNQEILWLAKTIIFHDCAHDIPPKIQSQPSLFEKLPPDKSLFRVAKGKGLPIGNLTSQFFANIYLNELDLFVKHDLKAKYYLRYVDDFIILDRDAGRLAQYRKQICNFVCEALALRVHPEKQTIGCVANGIDFVGYITRPDYVLVRRRVVDNWRHGLKSAGCAQRKQQINSAYLGHAKWANARTLTRKMSLMK